MPENKLIAFDLFACERMSTYFYISGVFYMHYTATDLRSSENVKLIDQ